MEKRKLGTSGLEVSAIGLGCASMSGSYGEADEKESIATMKRALDIGFTLFDTSDAYANGKNEELVGRLISADRQKLILATKFGNIRLPDGKRVTNGRPEYVIKACHQSLSRLNTDAIDLYYQHRIDPDTPIEETVGAMKRLVEEGKIRYLGLCEAGPQTLRRAHAVHPISVLQMEYSLWSRDAEKEILATCRELGVGFVAYSPLGRGFLTATVRDAKRIGDKDLRHFHPRFEDENLNRNLELLKPLEELAREKHCLPGQIALAWVLAQGKDIVPIFGTRRQQHLEENAKSIDIQLDKEELAQLNRVFKPGAASGERYPAVWMKRLGI